MRHPARLGASAAVFGENATIIGGNGIYLRSAFALNGTTPVTVAQGAAIIMLMRDNLNGGTALVMYENAVTPFIISQSGSNYITSGTPTGNQIKLETASPSNLGVQASMASGSSTTLHVAIITADD